MATYRALRAEGITTRAAALTGLSRATAGRKPQTPLRATRVVPANRLSSAERARVVTTLDSPRFVDQPPLQVYAQLLDEDTYLCSVSSMYRILGEHHQVRERRRLARHPARALYRRLPIWIQVQDSGRWAEASHANTVVTDGRLLCRFATGHLASLWWGGIVGLSVDLAAEHIVLDFGDGQLVNLAGPREDEPEQHCDPSRGVLHAWVRSYVLHAWVRSEVGHATSAMAATSVND